MDASLDFASRARHAWQQFRNPSGLNDFRAQEEGIPPNEAENTDRRASTWPLNPNESNPLNEFRLLVGIYQHKTFQAPHGFTPNRRPQAGLDRRPAPNMGIYTTVCDSEIKCKRNHKMFSRLINGCLGLQIVVAAALTALGAADGSRSAVTVFGAINTIIAGFLTYLKGSGLPGRLKFFQHEWTKVREYIEQRERDFMLDSHGLNPYEEVDKVRQMYEIVKADIESNRPDRFVSVSALSKRPITQNPGPSLARPQPSFSTESFRKGWGEKEKEMSGKAQGMAGGLFSNVTHLKDVLQDKVKEIGHMEKEMETKGHQMVDEKKHGMFGQIQSAVKEVAHLGKEIEAKAKAAATEKEMEVERAVAERRHEAEDAFGGARAGVAQQRDNFNSAVADRRHEAEDAYNGARAGVMQQRDNFNSAIAERRHDAEDAYNGARAGVMQQRDNFNAGIAERRHDAQDAYNGARAGAAQQMDYLNSAAAERRQDIEDAYQRGVQAARTGVEQQRDNFNAAVADRRHDAEDAINQQRDNLASQRHNVEDAARAEVDHQRDNADAALSHAQDEMARTSEAARAALQQQRDSLNAALVEGRDEGVPPREGSSQHP